MRTALCLLIVLSFACTGTIVGYGGGGGGSSADAGEISVDGSIAPDPDAPLPQLALATGIRIRDVAVYQGVQVPIVDNGANIPDSERRAHVVAGKAGMIGVFVDLAPEWQTREIVGELDIEVSPGQIRRYTATQTISSASGDNPFTTGFAFIVDGADFTIEGRYVISLKEAAPNVDYPGTSDGARFPAGEGEWGNLEAWSTHGPLNLVLVPFAYNADGSGRLPPIDEAALQRYKDLFSSMYPIGEINLTVHETVQYNAGLIGGGWGSWLDTLTALRDNDNPPANTYYYGIAAPRQTFSAYCSGGCITGLGWVPGRDDEYGRAAVGVSFADAINVFTSAHEIGHTLGRSHAPCGGPSGVDGSYPYSGARLGVWGYDAADQSLLAPDEHRDFMSYCSDQWISDYTYDGIARRLVYVNQLNAASVTPQRYRVGLVDSDGNVQWRRYDTIKSRLGGQPIALSRLRADGAVMGTVTGHFYAYDHLGGGMLLVPVVDGPAPAAINSDTTGTVAW